MNALNITLLLMVGVTIGVIWDHFLPCSRNPNEPVWTTLANGAAMDLVSSAGERLLLVRFDPMSHERFEALANQIAAKLNGR